MISEMSPEVSYAAVKARSAGGKISLGTVRFTSGAASLSLRAGTL